MAGAINNPNIPRASCCGVIAETVSDTPPRNSYNLNGWLGLKIRGNRVIRITPSRIVENISPTVPLLNTRIASNSNGIHHNVNSREIPS